MIAALGNNAHIFARPHRRQELARCFETALGCQVTTVEYPGTAEPMLIMRFPEGGSLSIEFTADAPDSDHPRLGVWLSCGPRTQPPPCGPRSMPGSPRSPIPATRITSWHPAARYSPSHRTDQ